MPRLEHDLLGDREVPDDVYWGVHTLRAVENFPISGKTVGDAPDLVVALALVKAACAQANERLGRLDSERAAAIVASCREIRAGALHDQFVVDLVQGGAGTSTNMNINEVIANRALELLGRPRGDYEPPSPQRARQSAASRTNDVYPTALRLAADRWSRQASAGRPASSPGHSAPRRRSSPTSSRSDARSCRTPSR